MKNLFSTALMLFFMLGTVELAHSESCQLPSETSTWSNELMSEMTLNVDNSGNLKGTYTTAVGCGAKIPRPLVGVCNGYAITFSVNWQECVSTTSWSGTVDKSGASINTLWSLVLAKTPSWDSIIAGTDKFTLKKQK